MGVEGFVKAKPESGYAVFNAHQDDMGADLGRHLEFRRLVFARQMVRVGELLTDLPESDRVTPIVAAARALGKRYAALWIEMPDTNDGKSLATLTRPLLPHLEKALRKAGIAIDDARRPRSACTCSSSAGAPATWAWPIRPTARAGPWGSRGCACRAAAPSRSAVKLAEALLEFFDDAERAKRFAPGMTAVDLGASPGGWTWQLVQRQMLVMAVDNGAIDARLMDSGQVKHRRDDGFHYRRRAGRLDGVRHGREPFAHRAARGAMDRRALVRGNDLQPQAAHEEALGGARALPRDRRRALWAAAATTCA